MSCLFYQVFADVKVHDACRHRFLKGGVKLSGRANHAVLTAADASELTCFGFGAIPYLSGVPLIPIVEIAGASPREGLWLSETLPPFVTPGKGQV